MAQRIAHIDVAKGISIVLVAMFHSPLRHVFGELIDAMSLFRVPLFFFLSGLFFSWKASPLSFMRSKSDALLKPYFAVALGVFVLSLAVDSTTSWWELLGIFYGNGATLRWTPMWFLTHLFLVYLCCYCLFRFGKFYSLSTKLKISLLLVFFLIGTIFIELFWQVQLILMSQPLKLPGLPLSLDLILISSACFLAGHLLKERVIHFRLNWLLLMIAICSFVLICRYTEAHVALNERIYDAPIYAALGGGLGVYVVMSVSCLIAKINWLAAVPLVVGKASLFILIFHNFIQWRVFQLVADEPGIEPETIFYALVGLLAGVAMPIAIQWLVAQSRWLSWVFFPLSSPKLLNKAN